MMPVTTIKGLLAAAAAAGQAITDANATHAGHAQDAAQAAGPPPDGQAANARQ